MSDELQLRIRMGNNLYRTRVEDAATGKPLPITRIVIDESVKDGSFCTITFPLNRHIAEGQEPRT